MIVYDDLIIETTLQNHTPATLRTRLEIALLGCGRITNHKDGGSLRAGCHQQSQQEDA